LTIKSYNPDYNVYNLGFPNEEVRLGFMKNLLPAYMPADIRKRSRKSTPKTTPSPTLPTTAKL
jgi:hypothetical protein